MAIGYEYNKTDSVVAKDRDYTRAYYYDFDNPNYDPNDPSTGTAKYYAPGRSIPIVTRQGVPGSNPGPVLFAFGMGYLTNPDTGKALTFDDNGRLTDFNLGKATGNAITFEGGDGLLLQDYAAIRAPIERHLVMFSGTMTSPTTSRRSGKPTYIVASLPIQTRSHFISQRCLVATLRH